MTPDQMAAMIDKVGVAITMLVVIIPCTFWIARLYIGAMNRMIETNAAHAQQLAALAAVATQAATVATQAATAATQASSESAKALARNTVSNDNLAARTDNLAAELKQLGCKFVAAKISETR